ncbi:Rha family transcriptional regulator [Methylobacter marinus]|uniref:Rha family transcriptional regulator n=1 Tax=Methylobacter marinus TaxID=34058 RepID=UPI0009FBAABA|nr:Rha family transcriptional regulator [Methylobacter marinus]
MPEKNSRKGNGSLRTLLKMTDLVIINSNKEAVTSHISIAEGMEVTQDSSLQLIKRYKADLEEFGRVRFQIVPFQTKGGVQKHKEYMLNRDQALFLITLMRNNQRTVAFKKRLVKQFSEMEAWIKERLQSSVEYKVMSSILKDARALAGKETESHHYANEAKLVNWAMTGAYKAFDKAALSQEEMELLNDLQARNAVLIGAGMTRENRKESLRIMAALNRNRLGAGSSSRCSREEL